jgi:hypothetical protein
MAESSGPSWTTPTSLEEAWRLRVTTGSRKARDDLNPRYRRHSGQPKYLLSRDLEAHTGFEPVLPENAQGKPYSGSKDQIAPGSELNPHLRAVLERLRDRDRERRG